MLLYKIPFVVFSLIVILYYPTQYCTSRNITTLCDHNIFAQHFSRAINTWPSCVM